MARSAVFPALRFRPEFGITPGLSANLTLPDYGRLARDMPKMELVRNMSAMA
jgi:hypothetical protein